MYCFFRNDVIKYHSLKKGRSSAQLDQMHERL